MMDKDILLYLDIYKRLGWHIIALREGEKAPLYSGWQSRDGWADVQSLLSTGTGFNIGIDLYRSGIVCIDIDSDEGLEELREKAEKFGIDVKELNKYTIQKTRKGFHILFKAWEGFERKRYIRVLEGVDILANGYIVATPSIVGNFQYYFITDPLRTFQEPSESLKAFIEVLCVSNLYEKGKTDNNENLLYKNILKGNKIAKGSRAVHLISLAGFLASVCKSANEYEQWLRYFDARSFDPPMQEDDAKEFEKILRWGSMYIDGTGKGFEPPDWVKKEFHISENNDKSVLIKDKEWYEQKAKEWEDSGLDAFEKYAKLIREWGLNTDYPKYAIINGKTYLVKYNRDKSFAGMDPIRIQVLAKKHGISTNDVELLLPYADAIGVKFYAPNESYKRIYIEKIDNNVYTYFNIADKSVTVAGSYSLQDIETTLNFLSQIAGGFGEKFNALLTWLKVLVFYPSERLPALVLVSPERGTGKTTFMNFLKLLLKGNASFVSSDVIESRFNAPIVRSRCIMIDEAIFEKTRTFEKLKNYITANRIMYEAKNRNAEEVEFFGVFVMASNSLNFLPVYEEIDRYAVLRMKSLEQKDWALLDKLKTEVSHFLAYLRDFNEFQKEGRVWFSAEQIREFFDNEELRSHTLSSYLQVVEEVAEDIVTFWKEGRDALFEWRYDFGKSVMAWDSEGNLYIQTKKIYEYMRRFKYISEQTSQKRFSQKVDEVFKWERMRKRVKFYESAVGGTETEVTGLRMVWHVGKVEQIENEGDDFETLDDPPF